MKIKDMPTVERPREKFLNNSTDNLSDVELLSINPRKIFNVKNKFYKIYHACRQDLERLVKFN